MKNALTCENLTIVKNSEVILQNVAFSLLPGALVKLMGGNGSGKTSLLRCIARLDKSNLGRLSYNCCDVDEFIDEYKQIILYISDKEQLNEEMTVFETMRFWAELYSSIMLVAAAANTFELEEYFEFKVKFLSKGLKKRLVLSRLLLQKARIWLLDEPFVNLDGDGLATTKNIIVTHLSHGGIVIASDHSEVCEESKWKDLADYENIGYKLENSSQLEKQKILLKMQDFKQFRN